MRSTIDCLQFNFSSCAPIFSIIASTSARDIGFAAAEAAADEVGAAADEVGAPAVALGALECPKIADTILPKMLIWTSSVLCYHPSRARRGEFFSSRST